jgi:hypothetical protein
LVFRGTIIELRDSKPVVGFSPGWIQDTKKIAVFRVIRVWKGEVGQTFEMPAIEETSACIGFWPSVLKVGSDLLVYASGNSTTSGYFTSICGFHKLARDALKDLKKLGPGKDPQNSK